LVTSMASIISRTQEMDGPARRFKVASRRAR
jgi:hypothetical protein